MAEPLTTAEAKAHLRVTDTSEDALIASYIVAAREWVEQYTGHVLVEGEIVDSYSAWGTHLTLRNQPINDYDPIEITYTDINGDPVNYADGVVRDQRYPWTIWPPTGQTFPTLGDQGSIIVTYTAGYADAASVPQALKQAMLLLIGQWHDNRNASGEEMFELPFAVTSLCRPYRGAVMA